MHTKYVRTYVCSYIILNLIAMYIIMYLTTYVLQIKVQNSSRPSAIFRPELAISGHLWEVFGYFSTIRRINPL